MKQTLILEKYVIKKWQKKYCYNNEKAATAAAQGEIESLLRKVAERERARNTDLQLE